MNAAQVLDHFDRISDAPDAVPRLRRFILDLAVRGKLAEQDPNDEPASKLVKRLLAKHPNNGLDSAEIAPEEPAFELPTSWAWIRIGHAAYVEMGQSPPSEHYNQSRQGLPFYQGKTDFGVRHPTPRYWCSQPTKLALKDDILISVRAPVGPTNLAEETCCIGRGLAALRPNEGVDRDFLLLCLKSFEDALAKLGFGTTFVAINKKQLISFPISLPPFAEQHRIVAKLDELMALCDRLEAAKTERESRRDKLAAASLRRLNNGANTGEFREHARFHLRHLPRLTMRLEHVQQLRQTILNLAVRGKLLPQDPTDEPVAELLKRIQAEKAQLVKDGESKPQKQPRPKTDGVESFSLPNSWRWISLGDVAFGFRYGTSVKCSYQPTGEPVLRIPNVVNGGIDIADLKYGALTEREANDLRLRLGDILMVRSNGSLNLVGRPALVEAQAIGFCYAGYLVRLRTSTVHLDHHYLVLALNTAHVRDQIEIPIRTTVGLKNVNATELSGLTIPLPPLAEQHRIVTKVEELMALCDRLLTQFNTIQTESGHLLEAVLQQALS